MAMTGVVTNVLRLADGTLAVGVTISARLVPPGAFRVDDSSEITPPVPVVSATTGAWSMILEQQSNIWPAGTYWEITEQLSMEQQRIWAVTVGAGFQTLQSALVSPPSPGSTAISLSANNAWTGNVGFFGHPAVGQQATPVTLADVIALLQAYGLSV